MTALIIPLPGSASKNTPAANRRLPEPPTVELRRARIRIAQLEASLSQAMRDNLANYNRAREAERELARLKL